MKTNHFKRASKFLDKLRANKQETAAEIHMYNVNMNAMKRTLIGKKPKIKIETTIPKPKIKTTIPTSKRIYFDIYLN